MTVIRQFKKEANEISTYFNLSFFQVKLDNEGSIADEFTLKLITLDKILKLYFDSYVCCYYEKNPEVLLTKDEIKYLKSKKYNNLIFVRKSIEDKKKKYNYKSKRINVFFSADSKWNVKKRILTKLLNKVL
ncbi:MAG: hypothetical protein JW866_09915 [Ignavibacteriales bacterium]|nr:hypothetical protein [Ignavibacteriales bacterium]